MTSRAWRIADGVMLVVFLLSALVQIDDPDPLPWIAVYGAAAALCGVALARNPGRAAPIALMLAALAAAAPLAPRVLGRAGVADVFGTMKATDPLVEETREMLGLLIIAGWMAGLAWRAAGARRDRAADARESQRERKDGMTRAGRSLLVALLALAPAALRAGETGTVAADDGVRIAWESQGSGEPTLVLVHCWACDRQFFKEQVPDLAADHRVVTLDLPGHGESGRNRESWSVTGLGADVVRVVDELGLERVILIGHSMGGPVSLAAAAELGDRALGVVLVDTVHDAEMAISPEMVEQIATPFEADYEAAMRRFVPAMFPEGADPGLPEWVIERALLADREAAVALMRAFEHVDEAALLSGAGVPVRAVNAAPLPPMIPDTATSTNRKYADFDAVKIEGVGHYLHLEKPREFNRALRAALAEVVAASP